MVQVELGVKGKIKYKELEEEQNKYKIKIYGGEN